MIDDLYSARILKLVANIPHAGRLPAPDASSEKISKLCGSRILVDVTVKDGRVADFAQEVKACALGQAAAAVLGATKISATSSRSRWPATRFVLSARATDPPFLQARFSEPRQA